MTPNLSLQYARALNPHVLRQPDGRSVAPHAVLEVPIAPLQYPSLEHMDATVESSIARQLELQAISTATATWARHSYRAFRRFLRDRGADSVFTQGDLRQQVALLEEWLIDMRRRGMQRGGINTTWRGLASVFRWLARASAIVNPILFVDPPKVGRRSPRFLPKVAAEQVLVFVQNRLWSSEFERLRNTVIIGLMLLAGLRRGEVIRVRIADVNLARGTIQLREAKGRDGGKDRTAYMPPQLRTIVAAYMEEMRKLPPRAHPELVTSATRNRALSAGAVTRVCTIITRECGIRVAPHMLRHTYATLLRQAGVLDRVAMELMGHADLRMLLRYSHVEADEPREAAERLTLEM